MNRLWYLKNLKSKQHKHYKNLREEYLKSYDIKKAIKRTFKSACYSSVRANLCFYLLTSSIETLINDKFIYNRLSKEQKTELDFYYKKISDTHNNSKKILRLISELV